ncbi:MAG: hypothetical protein MUC48_08505 [Leptolyngbya sp. Prado105]|jgi:hypothetical protein|nr:hypothetical protein [Leptolyngbya sp. Prado105]
MTGFIRGFFSKPRSSEAPAPVEKPKKEKAIRSEKESDAFFLDSDSAQTFGNLEYMRESKKIRRTFPKTLDSPAEKEFVQELSAMDRVGEGKPQMNTTAKVERTPTESVTPTESAPRRSTGSDMDIFMQMAKDMRK